MCEFEEAWISFFHRGENGQNSRIGAHADKEEADNEADVLGGRGGGRALLLAEEEEQFTSLGSFGQGLYCLWEVTWGDPEAE